MQIGCEYLHYSSWIKLLQFNKGNILEKMFSYFLRPTHFLDFFEGEFSFYFIFSSSSQLHQSNTSLLDKTQLTGKFLVI